MSRSIKFRFWHTARKSYYKIKQINLATQGVVLEELGLRSIQHDGFLEQYTGLKDKNGIEICVGDIVVTHDDEYNPSKLKIESRKGNSVACDDNIGYEEPISNHHYKDWEVIGNIHENIDLLGGKYVQYKHND